MQKLLYVPLLCFGLYTNSAHGMFKRRASSVQDNKAPTLIAPAATKPQSKPNKTGEVDISVQLRKVLEKDPDAYFNRGHQDSEEEGDDEEEGEEDDDDSTSPPISLRSAFDGKSIASLLPRAVEPIAEPAKILPLITSTKEREQQVVAAVRSKQIVETEAEQSLLKLGRKFALLKTIPLEQVQLINIPAGTDNVTPHMKQFFLAKLAVADDAVTIDDTDSSKPRVIIDLNKYFVSVSDLSDSQEQEITPQSPPARYVSLSGGEDNNDDSQEEPQRSQPYADRYTLGLKLEWLLKLPLDQIDVINFDPSLTAEEQSALKKELVALLASTATAVNTNLEDDDFDTPRLIIDISKLTGYAALIACRKQNAQQQNNEQSVQTKDQQSVPPSAQKDTQQEIKQQQSLVQKLGIPIATGVLCFALGYLFAKTIGTSH